MEYGNLGPKMSKAGFMTRPHPSMTKGVLLCFFAIAYFFLYARVLWRIGDEGTLVYGAQLVAQGALPYRDFFEVMGPGSFYWLGLFFKVFGTNILVARTVLLLTATFTILLLYWMTRRIYQGPFDIFPSIFYLFIGFPVWPGTSHHWDSNLFALLALGAFFLWQDRGRRWFLPLAGVLAGLTSCFVQQKGLCLIAALSLVVWWNGYRAGEARSTIASHVGIMLGGYFAVGGLVLLFFYLAGGLPDLIYANLIWPLTQYHNVNYLPYGYGINAWFGSTYQNILQGLLPPYLSPIMDLLILIPILFIACLPFFLLVLIGFIYFQKVKWARTFNAIMFPYWVAGLALWVSELHRKDIVHLIYGSPLLLILFLVIWNSCFDTQRGLRNFGLRLITVCLILFGSVNALMALSTRQEIVTRRGKMYGFKQDTALQFLIEHTKPGDYAFIYPYYPMYYFLADVRNPTRYSILLYHINTEAQFDEVIQNLKQKRVKYVLWDTLVAGAKLKTWFPQYEHPPEEKLLLEHYLKEDYREIGTENGFRILRRREDKPAD